MIEPAIKLEEEEQIRARLDRVNYYSKNEMERRDKRIEFLESENDRLRDDRNEHYLSNWSDAEDSSPVAAGRALKGKSINHVGKDKMVKIKWKPEKIHFDVGFDTSGLTKGNKVRKSEPRYVRKEFLRSETFRHQAIDELIARARAKVLNNDIHGRKPEVKVLLGKIYMSK